MYHAKRNREKITRNERLTTGTISFPVPFPRSKWRLKIAQNGVQNGKLQDKNCGVFCHVTHDEMSFSDFVSSDW